MQAGSKEYFLLDSIRSLEAVEKELPEVSPIINEIAKIKEKVVNASSN